eukprot:m.51378 g.51378  ORF g.51378 m.51378 type:complete len:52 (+) comp18146_c0_seq1:2996-3151(+)
MLRSAVRCLVCSVCAVLGMGFKNNQFLELEDELFRYQQAPENSCHFFVAKK